MKKITILISLVLLLMNTTITAKPRKLYKGKFVQEAITEKKFSIDSIENFSITEFATVELEYSTKNSISIFTDSSNHKYVKLDKTTNSMEVYLDKNRPANFHSKEMKIIIYTNQLKKISTSKVAVLKSVNQYISNKLEVTTSSTASININVKSEEFIYNGNSCANVSIIGNAEKAGLNCNSISKFDISLFQSNFVNIEAESCAKLFLHAEKELQIKANSIAKIIYSGKFIISNQVLTSVTNVRYN
ncbi:MAG: DUF2807 domain-containing protein [Bacteroidetes bacterium]|jgi:predicted nucleic acid-binding Zn finger protein|nr:DUF2807 domain-containing protein [Bacteroidota bacterium]MBP7255792.1 DUF2807 domain-containing protein [Chitinophagales bacterium]MBK7641169.1 DUF2807 domain-containing protein [Bacteroidota bacterium]MBK9633340.1 DUF2807 domain-containing protein [Bacteroidota bacterium]MBL0078013.1 DUF2807 domain-containing protein [Bacteroidota bacterium]